MARPNYGPQAKKLAKRLLEVLLAYANDELNNCDHLQIQVNWQTQKQLVVRTKVRFLEELTIRDSYEGKLNKEQIKEALKRLEDFLGILEDNRTTTKGAENWHFTLKLWHNRQDIQANLKQLDVEWERRRTKRSQQVVTEEVSVDKTKTRFPNTNKHQDWGEAVDVSVFYGRTQELATLEQWIVNERCGLVAILGMGGIGKTSVCVKLVQQIQENFKYVIWQSLQNAPPVEEILARLIHFFSQQKEISLPNQLDAQVSRVLHYLRLSRCLLVLDNIETVLQDGTTAGRCKGGYEGYDYLLKRLGEVNHQSCLILTSREKPKEIALLEASTLRVRSLQLPGLTLLEGREIFNAKGCFGASEQDLQAVCTHYAGNPLALTIVALAVQEVYGGELGKLIPELLQGKLQIEDINDLLEGQFNRLSPLEQQVMYWLAVNREPVSLAKLGTEFACETMREHLLGAVQSLRRRALIEQQEQQLGLQSAVLEYVTHRIIDLAWEDIVSKRREFLNNYTITKAQSKEYIRQAQVHLIVRPIIDRLVATFGNISNVECQLKHLLGLLRQEMPLKLGYAAGNILNILCEIKADLSNLDCSNLVIWQAYLANTTLHNVNFTGSQFAKCAFKQVFGPVLCVAFSPNGEVLASSDTQGEISLWRIADGQCLLTIRGHTNWVQKITFSPDGSSIASTSMDSTIRIWDVHDGKCLQIIQEYSCISYSICFSPDGKLLASSCHDCKVRIWDLQNRKCLQVMEGHVHWVFSVSFSPDGNLLASGSCDRTIRIWDVHSGKCNRTISGHDEWVVPITFSPNGRQIASASFDTTVRIWNVEDGMCLHILQGHTKRVWSVAWSPDGELLASTGVDQTIRIWSPKTGQCFHVISGHTHQIWSVAFHPDSIKLVSGSNDQTIRFWDARNGKCLGFMGGHLNWTRSVAFYSDGQTLVSAHKDCSIRIWDITSRKCLHTLTEHKNSVLSVAFAPNTQIFATGSEDQMVKIWHLSDCCCLHTLTGHTDAVWSVAFSPNAQLLASSSLDRTIRIWDVNYGICLHTLVDSDRVGCVAFNPNGFQIACASEDQSVKLWDVRSGQCLQTIRHQQRLWSVAFSPDGKSIATGGLDKTIKIWDVQNSKCLHTLVGHTGWVLSIIFSPDGHQLISSSSDRTLKIWDLLSGQCLCTKQYLNWVWSVALSPNNRQIATACEDGTIYLLDKLSGEWEARLQVKRPYEGMNILAVRGITPVQEAGLRALGAVEFRTLY